MFVLISTPRANSRTARQETRQSNTELRRLVGSRKRLLRRLIQSSLPGSTPQIDGHAEATSPV